MRFNCVAKGENCLVDVALNGKDSKVTIYAGEQAKAKIGEFDVRVFALPDHEITSLALHEQAARIGLGSYEALESEGWPARKSEPFVGLLTPL